MLPPLFHSLEQRRLLSASLAHALPQADPDYVLDGVTSAGSLEEQRDDTTRGTLQFVPVASDRDEIHAPVPGASSPTVVQLWEDLQDVRGIVDNSFPGGLLNPDERALIVRAMEENYLQAYSQDLDALAAVMETADMIVDRVAGGAGSLNGMLSDANMLMGILGEDGPQELGALLSQRLTELGDLVGSEALADFTGNADMALAVLDAVGMARAMLDAGDPVRFLDYTSSLMGLASTFAPPIMSNVFDIYGDAVDALKDMIEAMLDNLARHNLTNLKGGNDGHGGAAVAYTLAWAKNVLDGLGVDWKTEYPAAYE